MFTKEFKLAAVQRLEQGVSMGEVARALELNPKLRHRWRQRVPPGAGQHVSGQRKQRWSEGRIAAAETQKKKVGRVPKLMAADAGYCSQVNEGALQDRVWPMCRFRIAARESPAEGMARAAVVEEGSEVADRMRGPNQRGPAPSRPDAQPLPGHGRDEALGGARGDR